MKSVIKFILNWIVLFIGFVGLSHCLNMANEPNTALVGLSVILGFLDIILMVFLTSEIWGLGVDEE